MCGLALLLNKQNRPAGQYAFQLYQKQAARGRQGYGYIGIKDGKIVSVQRAKTEPAIKELLMKEKSDTILFHHRFPTSTENTLGTTHPMFVAHDELEYDYYFAHNGIITNAAGLKLGHEKLGYFYNTEFTELAIAKYKNGTEERMNTQAAVFNDSESLAIELARYIEGKTEAINTVGAAAFWGVSIKKGTDEVVDIFYGKNLGRDLKMHRNKKWFTVTSETGTDVEDLRLFTLNYRTREITERELDIDKSAPKTTPPIHNAYGYNMRGDYELPQTNVTPKGLPAGIRDYNALENKLYTRNEASDTGYPLTEFFTVWNDGFTYYVPQKFAGQESARVMPKDEQPAGNKNYQLLDDYAEKIAAMEAHVDQLYDEQLTGEEGEYADLQAQIGYAEAKIAELEDKIAGLGIETEIIEEVLDTARQLEAYQPIENEIRY